MWTRAELKDNAKKFFKFNYWKMVLVAFIMTMIGGGSGGFSAGYPTRDTDSFGISYMSPSEAAGFLTGFMTVLFVVVIISLALSLFVFNPLVIGAQRFFVVSHYQKAELNELGFAFTHSYLNIVKTMFLMNLYVFLWSLLLIIPGIIKSYEYRMIPYILAENPDIDSKQAFAMSKQMMDGNKWDAFVLGLSFFGWIILGVLLCGIPAIFYVNPYILMTNAELYVALKEITYGGQSRYQNVYQQDNAQWGSNNNQWSNNNAQWNNGNNQWSNNNGQWSNNNQWNNNNSHWNNDNNQWNDNNSQWNNDQPNSSDQWNSDSPEK